LFTIMTSLSLSLSMLMSNQGAARIEKLTDAKLIVSHLPGGHLPPPKFGHLPPPNSDISHPQKKTFARRTTATPNFFLLFLAHFSWLFRLTAHGGHQGWEGGGA